VRVMPVLCFIALAASSPLNAQQAESATVPGAVQHVREMLLRTPALASGAEVESMAQRDAQYLDCVSTAHCTQRGDVNVFQIQGVHGAGDSAIVTVFVWLAHPTADVGMVSKVYELVFRPRLSQWTIARTTSSIPTRAPGRGLTARDDSILAQAALHGQERLEAFRASHGIETPAATNNARFVSQYLPDSLPR
jgi:hypothetical protein